MPIDYKIFNKPNLVCIRYSGHVVLPEVTAKLAEFAQEPKSYLGQPHFFDLSHVTSYDFDYAEFFHLLGDLADVYPACAGEHLFVFYAPEGPPADLAAHLRKPFNDADHIIIRVATTLDQAFDILGYRPEHLLAHLSTQSST